MFIVSEIIYVDGRPYTMHQSNNCQFRQNLLISFQSELVSIVAYSRLYACLCFTVPIRC